VKFARTLFGANVGTGYNASSSGNAPLVIVLILMLFISSVLNRVVAEMGCISVIAYQVFSVSVAKGRKTLIVLVDVVVPVEESLLVTVVP
jgi:hypothetical protein